MLKQEEHFEVSGFETFKAAYDSANVRRNDLEQRNFIITRFWVYHSLDYRNDEENPVRTYMYEVHGEIEG
jgi:hypothetical protein